MKPTPYTSDELRQALADRRAGLTLQQFAAELDLSFQFISQVLNGTRSIDNEKILDYLAPKGMKYVREDVYYLVPK